MRCHYGVINKLQVVAAAGIVEFRGLFAFHLTRAVIIDNLLFQLVSARFLRINMRIDHHIAVTRLVKVGVGKFKMLSPVRSAVSNPLRIQAIGIFLRLVRIKKPRSCRQAVICLFFGKFHTNGKHLQRICRKRRR